MYDVDVEGFYNMLYQEFIPDTYLPFEGKVNSKLEILSKMPGNNLRCLDQFQKYSSHYGRVQNSRQKRIPKIVEMLLTKRQGFHNHQSISINLSISEQSNKL